MIKHKGAGNYGQKRLKPIGTVHHSKTPSVANSPVIGSLTINIKKQEALKIDRENLRMA